MHLYSYDHMSLETDLRMALERNEYELFYQPQIELRTKKVVGNEALLRWRHPNRGLLSPIHFIETLENTGLIITVGKWVIEEACRQQMHWNNIGFEPMNMCVNISAMQFNQPNFSKMVKDIICETGIDPKHLELEVTESLCMHDVKAVLKTLHELNYLGVRLAIDDFGTGFSNLSYLKKFPIDRLKIDQSFIRSIENEHVNVGIVTAIASLGKSMNLDLVAEGVENINEMEMAEFCGCDIAQGYYFSKPLPASQLETWFGEYKSLHMIKQQA
jgi:EAL domain-containing protein (putative c-di-GMP-specific phosphodiesterase class I)